MRIFLLCICGIVLLLLSSCGNSGSAGGPLPTLPFESEPIIVNETINKIIPAELIETRDTCESKSIRVLINTSHFASRIHGSVTITATGAFVVRGGGVLEGATERHFDAGEFFSLQRVTDMAGYEYFCIQPITDCNQLVLVGLGRNWGNNGHPSYRGRLEIRVKNGGFLVVNELCFEEYLYAVVPSEMPSSFGLEASKIQAITARSFAYRQFYEMRFRAYGAHIDDSVMSQVYNNLPETEISIEAVRATRGLILAYNGEVILANYFSTSGGTTANSGEVWAGVGAFPAETPPFLRARAQFEPSFTVGDLRYEENAAAFFKNTDVPAFERDLPWFRWQVRMTAQELTTAINARGVGNIGQIYDLQVIQRGQGGNIMELLIVGTSGSAPIFTEFEIRATLAPRNSRLTLNNGTTLNGWGMMPSAFFTMEKERDVFGALVAVTFYGGGHGHGVGMSQNGARALLDRGFTYREVLAHFYPGTEVVEMGTNPICIN
ncbi:MAG: SpoIID/LytB domain-containing protein [Defluviitaleaceae bacterium]|nr:SpoIID/LytB domain-containing protein [Defluviitaleaceae bacterium]MCL2276169.1 SpoIID/LytB domain-containing protein [Defluviitaleaceae bacterium]